jgi:hypothetical protein
MADISQLIEALNHILEGTWTIKEIKDGKRVIFPIGLGETLMHESVKKFREVGWNVRRVVELSGGNRTHYLEFVNPNWKKEALTGPTCV